MCIDEKIISEEFANLYQYHLDYNICKTIYFQQQDFAFYSQFFGQIQSKICFDEFEITFLLFYYYHYYHNIDEDAADLKWHLVMAHTHTGTAN